MENSEELITSEASDAPQPPSRRKKTHPITLLRASQDFPRRSFSPIGFITVAAVAPTLSRPFSASSVSPWRGGWVSSPPQQPKVLPKTSYE